MFFRVIITKIIFIYHYLFVIWLFLCEKASEVQLFYIISCKQYYHRVESALKDTFHRQTLIGTLNKIHVKCTTQWQSVLKCKVIIQFSEPPPPKTMLKYCGSVGWKKSTYLYLGCGRGRWRQKPFVGKKAKCHKTFDQDCTSHVGYIISIVHCIAILWQTWHLSRWKRSFMVPSSEFLIADGKNLLLSTGWLILFNAIRSELKQVHMICCKPVKYIIIILYSLTYMYNDNGLFWKCCKFLWNYLIQVHW